MPSGKESPKSSSIPSLNRNMAYQFDMEVTDTFGNEANYAWVSTATIEVKTNSQRAIVRAAKALNGWTGLKCRVSDFGNMIEIRPCGICQVAFINTF